MSALWATFKGVGRLFKVVVTMIVTLLVFVFLVVIVTYFYFAKELPNIQTVSDYHPQRVTTVYGSDGTVIGEFWYDERRKIVPVEAIPEKLIHAFVAAEDTRFLEHRGIDFRGILRAFLANWKAGEIVQGGSTITQQVTRSLLLSREQSYTRKIKEAILANRLERYLNKEQILYLYLNQIYFGNRAYGIKAAAENYFHKDLKNLNLAEISLLASVPRAPNLYSPFKNPEKVIERQRYVLGQLVKEGGITPEEKAEALRTEMTLYMQGTDKESNLRVAPHFMEFLRQELLRKYGDEKLYYGGLKVHTPLDPAMQKAAVLALRRGLEVVDRRQGGWRGPIETVAPESLEAKKEELHGRILARQAESKILFPPRSRSQTGPLRVEAGEIYPALVTGFNGSVTQIAVGHLEGEIPLRDVTFGNAKLSYPENFYISSPSRQLRVGDVIRVRSEGDDRFSFYQEPLIQGALYAQETASGYTRAMVGGYDFRTSEFNRARDALRQPGSAFKPFVYAAALDKGYSMDTTVLDAPFAIPVAGRIWAPKNYSGNYRGPVSLHTALVHSYNVVAARIAYHIGLDYLTAYQRKMGVTTPIKKYPSMALGANGVNLHELVAAYATFPNGGIYKSPRFITKILDAQGNILEQHDPLREEGENASLVDAGDQWTLDAQTEDLNPSLFEANKDFLQKDHLSLSSSELRVLYGSNIPPGHVMTPQTAYLMASMMQDVVRMGTGRRVAVLGKPVAGKTGTTNDQTDTWFVGYTPDLAAGAWVGYDAVRNIGRGEQGGRTAAPIFLDFMQQATEGWQARKFAPPPDLDTAHLASLNGGSAIYAELPPLPYFGDEYGGASSQESSSDFMEVDMETFFE